QMRWLETITRVERLQDWLDELAGGFDLRETRSNLERLAASLLRLEQATAIAHRELVAMGSGGYWDALLGIAPVGGHRGARGFLFGFNSQWATERRLEVVILHEPMASSEAIVIALKGPFAYGYLKGETGHHRFRRDRDGSVARVRVA